MDRKKLAIVLILGGLLQGCSSRSKQPSSEDLEQISGRIKAMDEKLSVIMDLMQEEAQMREAEGRGMSVRSLNAAPEGSSLDGEDSE